MPSANALLDEIAGCTVCSKALAAGPRPVVQFSAASRIVIIGQAPSSNVHRTGVPWHDASGDRLRSWTGLGTEQFYDPAQIALMPMGFCYPGRGKSGDLPPRRECAPLWHQRILKTLQECRLKLLVGGYAQAWYLKTRNLTETVKAFRAYGPALFPLPHPSWRSRIWMDRNPWFEVDVLPALRAAVAGALGGAR